MAQGSPGHRRGLPERSQKPLPWSTWVGGLALGEGEAPCAPGSSRPQPPSPDPTPSADRRAQNCQEPTPDGQLVPWGLQRPPSSSVAGSNPPSSTFPGCDAAPQGPGGSPSQGAGAQEAPRGGDRLRGGFLDKSRLAESQRSCRVDRDDSGRPSTGTERGLGRGGIRGAVRPVQGTLCKHVRPSPAPVTRSRGPRVLGGRTD